MSTNHHLPKEEDSDEANMKSCQRLNSNRIPFVILIVSFLFCRSLFSCLVYFSIIIYMIHGAPPFFFLCGLMIPYKYIESLSFNEQFDSPVLLL